MPTLKNKKKVVFIDRDGVINKDPGGWTKYDYVTKWDEFIFLPNAIEGLKILTREGYDIVIISNQAGISKRYFTMEDLDRINRALTDEAGKHGAGFSRMYYCIHQDSDNCDCRKPKPGLFKKAEKEMSIKVKGNFFIGDTRIDVEAGHSMGMKTILVLSGKSTVKDAEAWSVKPDYIFKDLLEAAKFLVHKQTD